MNGFRLGVSFPYLILKARYFFLKANEFNLLGNKFFSFGKKIARTLLFKGIFSPKLFLNPVSIVRYFEYDFVDSNIENKVGARVLDVSSPYLFGFYVTEKHKVDYNYINPDKEDLSQLTLKAAKLKFAGQYKTAKIDATNLPYQNNYFDNIISISVIEHIDKGKDSIAIQQMWRTLKLGGKLLLTFPVCKKYYEEFRKEDVYNLGTDQKETDYFFQRVYDEQSIENRILNPLNNYEILSKKIFGEKDPSFYELYKKRWDEKSYFETVKDPYYISKYFKEFESTVQLPGIGVMGLSIRKKK